MIDDDEERLTGVEVGDKRKRIERRAVAIRSHNDDWRTRDRRQVGKPFVEALGDEFLHLPRKHDIVTNTV